MAHVLLFLPPPATSCLREFFFRNQRLLRAVRPFCMRSPFLPHPSFADTTWFNMEKLFFLGPQKLFFPPFTLHLCWELAVVARDFSFSFFDGDNARKPAFSFPWPCEEALLSFFSSTPIFWVFSPPLPVALTKAIEEPASRGSRQKKRSAFFFSLPPSEEFRWKCLLSMKPSGFLTCYTKSPLFFSPPPPSS